MRVVIAPDKFKGSLTAVDAARAIAEGVFQAAPDALIDLCPMADGGEGTVDAVASATGAELREEAVSGPLEGQRVTACWALIPPGAVEALRRDAGLAGLLVPGTATGLIEMAQASGLSLVPGDRRDPMATSTLGTGQLILKALDAGCRQVVVGIGGSGTVDGGTGMARALGYRLLDARGRELPGGGACLESLSSIDPSGADPRLSETGFLVASDVDSPLLGPQGAARVFGPQKGATPRQVESLERGLARLAEVVLDSLGVDVREVPGAGAAGGLGAGLVAFCGAKIASGVMLIAGLTKLEEKIEGADLVLTGEGRFDSQSSRGKTPAGVVDIAGRHGVPAVVLAGEIAGEAVDPLGPGAAAFCILPGPVDLHDAMAGAAGYLRSGAARLIGLLELSGSLPGDPIRTGDGSE